VSHIVSIQTKVHDPVAIRAACNRLGLGAPVQGKAKLFSGVAEGILVQLPGWRYPVVIEPLTGTVRFDNYGGQWGAQSQLDRFLQAYAVEKAKLEARKQCRQFSEQHLADGSIVIRIQERSAA